MSLGLKHAVGVWWSLNINPAQGIHMNIPESLDSAVDFLSTVTRYRKYPTNGLCETRDLSFKVGEINNSSKLHWSLSQCSYSQERQGHRDPSTVEVWFSVWACGIPVSAERAEVVNKVHMCGEYPHVPSVSSEKAADRGAVCGMHQRASLVRLCLALHTEL